MNGHWFGFEFLSAVLRGDGLARTLLLAGIVAVLVHHKWKRRAASQTPAEPSVSRELPTPPSALVQATWPMAIEHFTNGFLREAHRFHGLSVPFTERYFYGPEQVFDCGADSPPLRVCSEGLAALGRPEFELLDVPVALHGAARMLLKNVWAFSEWQTPLGHDDAFVLSTPANFAFSGRLVEKESFGRTVLRVCDLTDDLGELPPRHAVSSAAVFEAREAIARGETEEARRLLEAAIAWFPGTKGTDLALPDGNVNLNNSLAYLMLSDLGVDREANYVRALQRDDALTSAELGGPVPSFVPQDALEQDAHSLVTTLQDGHVALAGEPGTGASGQSGLVLTPLLRLADGQLQQQLSFAPLLANSYFYTSPVRERLREPTSARLAAELYAQGVEDPHALLVRTLAAARNVLQSGFGFEGPSMLRPAPEFTSAAGRLDHLPTLSRILSALGRAFAAGLSDAEARAHFRLIDSPADAVSAERKLETLRALEAPALLGGLGH